MSIVRSDKPFVLAGRTYQSRLLVGTGKYRDMEETWPSKPRALRS